METQYGTIRIGQIVKLFTDGIGLDALLESVSEKEDKITIQNSFDEVFPENAFIK